MQKTITTIAFLCAIASRAAIINFDLSPAGTDNAVGLSPLNESPAVTNSTGSGNEIGAGITFDTDTLVLSLSLGYGSAAGFTDLTGPATAMHIHGQAPTNISAGVLIDLSPLHLPATNAAAGGTINGTVTLTADQAIFLLAGSNYINIHTATNAAGEIRGQLIPVNTLPTIICPAPATLECDGSGGRLVGITAQVGDVEGDALTVVWTVDGVGVLTNDVPAGTPPTSLDVMLAAFLTLGEHQVTISVSDATDAGSCSTTVTIVDTMPPVIVSASATPNVLWPPNHKMVPVAISVVATDLCSTATCRIKTITSNEPIQGPGKGKSPDWTTDGALSAKIRAERLGKGSGRVYTIVIECTDTSGNSATRNVTVTVPHDQGKKPKDNKGKGNSKGQGQDDQGDNGKNGKGNNDQGNNGKGANGQGNDNNGNKGKANGKNK